VLDAIVDRISGNPLPAARLLAATLVQTGKDMHAIARFFRSGSWPDQSGP
jgi:hypothetical protein